MTLSLEPYTISVPDADLDDLRRRLGATRWPEREPVEDWSQGMPLAYLQEICRYWAEDYDWRATERRLNALPQFTAEIDALRIHLLHVRSPHDDAMPLVITHGWPGSFIEFLKVLGPLTDPTAHGGDAADAFHLVVPSMPGYGFSAKPTEPGWGVDRIARAWSALMIGLGYDRFGAQGGDWGSAVTSAIAQQDPEHCLGIHLNMPLVQPDPATMDDLTATEQTFLESLEYYNRWDGGYSAQQASRPQTLGYGLTDSPSAQAAWIIEKFWSWTDCDGHPENALTRDEMLDNVMLYWLPATGTSSARLYWESFGTAFAAADSISVPTGASIFPHEIMRPSRRWVERRYLNLIHWNEMEKGGHFAAFEQPEAFVSEVRTSFRSLR